MLVHLDLGTEDRWTVLIGEFAVLHGPVTSAIMAEAREACIASKTEERWAEITKFVARHVIRDWRGVADETTDSPIPVTPAAVDAVMDIYPIFLAFNANVIDARIRIDREKKGLPTSQNGASGSEPSIAPAATGPVPTAPED